MDLNVLWFILVAVLYAGFFVLEGFDFGVGILLPFIGKKDEEKRAAINTIGPVWDANEVWLVLAAGATFAAFPQWYATLFSGFYLPLLFILVALILRGVSFEFRSKLLSAKWRGLWDATAFIGSLFPPLLLGVAFANMLKGVPIDANMDYTGGFFNLFSLYALLGGLTFLGLSALLGALFLNLKTAGSVQENAEAIAARLWIPVFVVLVVFVAWTLVTTRDVLAFLAIVFGVISLTCIVAGYLAARAKRDGWAFGLLVAAIATNVATIFASLFPNVMVSSTDPAYSLTIINASSSAYTLTVMSIVAAIFLPIVLAYQAWNYWVFRKRISAKVEDLHY